MQNLVNYNNQIREDNEVVSKSSLVLDNNYIIEFNNVVFSYPSRPRIRALDSISFKIPTGKFIGIVGKSGSGKTSIILIPSVPRHFYLVTNLIMELNYLSSPCRKNIVFCRIWRCCKHVFIS